MQSRSGEWWPDVVSVIESKRESRPTQREEYVLLFTGRATTSYSHRERGGGWEERREEGMGTNENGAS